jgi:hypothetical protein
MFLPGGILSSVVGVLGLAFSGRAEAYIFFPKESILGEKVKVKVTLVHALRLCTGRTAHRGSRGIALLFHDNGTRRG